MTFNPETTDPRAVLSTKILWTIEPKMTIGQYLIRLGRVRWNSRTEKGSHHILSNVYNDLGQTLSEAGFIGTKTELGTDWNGTETEKLIEFLFDYLTKLDFTQLPEPERPKEYVVTKSYSDGFRTLVSTKVYTRAGAEACLKAFEHDYPQTKFQISKVTPA